MPSRCDTPPFAGSLLEGDATVLSPGQKDFCAIEKINAPTRLCEREKTLRMIDGILD